MFELTETVLSVKYNKKRTGPKTKPWGTPEMMFAGAERDPFTDAVCVRFDRNGFIH